MGSVASYFLVLPFSSLSPPGSSVQGVWVSHFLLLLVEVTKC